MTSRFMTGATGRNITSFSVKGSWRSRFSGQEDEFSFGHVESEVPVNHQGGNVQRYLDI